MTLTRHPLIPHLPRRRRLAPRSPGVQRCTPELQRDPSRGPIDWIVASTPADIDACQKIRCEVYREAGIGIKGPRFPREVGRGDLLPTAKHVLVRCGSAAIGTLRLALPDDEVAADNHSHFGFGDEDSYDMSRLESLRPELAEVARVALKEQYRKGIAFSKMLTGLITLAREHRRRWLLGTLDCGSSRRDDGEIMYRVAAARGLVDPVHHVTGGWAGPDADEIASELNGPGFYTDEQRARGLAGDYADLPLSPALEIFTRTMNAKVIGQPSRHKDFDGRLVIPVLADLKHLPRSTLAAFVRDTAERPTTARAPRKACR